MQHHLTSILHGHSRPPASRGRAILKRAATLLLPAVALFATSPDAAQAQPFSNSGIGLTDVYGGSIAWGDYDNDGIGDILMTGQSAISNPSGGRVTAVYKGSSGGTVFTPQSFGLTAVAGSGRNGATWVDFNNDDYLDIFITGNATSGNVAILYRNNAGASFTAMSIEDAAGTLTSFTGVTKSAVTCGDYDRDGDMDLAYCGISSGTTPVTRVYRNDGAGGSGRWRFTELTGSFANVSDGAMVWTDHDLDNDLDLFVTGLQSNGTPITRFYRNTGNAFFDAGTLNLPNLGRSSIVFGHYDSNQELDCVIMGVDAGGTKHLKVYQKVVATGNFSLVQTLPGVSDGSLAWADYDNSFDKDLLVTGLDNSGTPVPVTRLYRHTALYPPVFSLVSPSGLTNVYNGQAVFADRRNNGKLDILLTGRDGTGMAANPVTRIYTNGTTTTNAYPPTPALSGSASTFATAKSATIGFTSVGDYGYSGRIFNNTTSSIYMPSASTTANPSFHRLADFGNLGMSTGQTAGGGYRWTVTGLTPGTSYTFQIQNVDQGFRASQFASITLTTTALSQWADAYIKDCPLDNGLEPSWPRTPQTCPGFAWRTSDLWLRNKSDNVKSHQNVAYGGDKYIYIDVTNRHPGVMTKGGKVHVYWTKKTTNPIWQREWTDHAAATVNLSAGRLIGIVDVTPFNTPTKRVMLTWPAAAIPSGLPGNLVLLGRYISDDDPMTYPEVSNTGRNVNHNNNVVWNGVQVQHVQKGGGGGGGMMMMNPIIIGNPSDEPTAMTINFEVPAAEIGDNILNHGTMSIDLGPDLKQRWVTAGSPGFGVGDGGGTQVNITAPNAWIGGFALLPNEVFNVGVTFIPLPMDPMPIAPYYNWDIVQYGADPAYPVGGTGYLFDMFNPPPDTNDIDTVDEGGGDPEPPPTKSTLGSSDRGVTGGYSLAAAPNPTGSTTMITYTLPVDTRVTLAIYDMAGRLVRRIVTDLEQKMGGYSIEWDGRDEGGVPVTSGAYLYRLETPTMKMNRQIMVVR